MHKMASLILWQRWQHFFLISDCDIYTVTVVHSKLNWRERAAEETQAAETEA